MTIMNNYEVMNLVWFASQLQMWTKFSFLFIYLFRFFTHAGKDYCLVCDVLLKLGWAVSFRTWLLDTCRAQLLGLDGLVSVLVSFSLVLAVSSSLWHQAASDKGIRECSGCHDFVLGIWRSGIWSCITGPGRTDAPSSCVHTAFSIHRKYATVERWCIKAFCELWRALQAGNI